MEKYNKNVSSQCNMPAQIEQVQDKNVYFTVTSCYQRQHNQKYH